MRLLKCEKSSLTSTSTFRLSEHYPRQIPHYAILSHRWGSDEVTFRDVEDGTAEVKADGYKKLEFCAAQAAQDGLLYFWVDTCCIDKTNNTELSEAINSMFKWYHNAAKCYVYLADVSVEGDWQADFQKSEWFTRGWTLQELLAPSVVEFFSKEGTKLGDKRSLEQQIHQATGIPVDVLRGKALSEIEQRERFSWAARRQTTFEEDATYCLLGIFNVHMPLIYGEGQQNALMRLQQKIRLLANPLLYHIKDAAWVVPFERNARFTGREAQLADLEGRLFSKHQTSKIAIFGMGGVGKTQLVLELLYQTKEQHPDCSILWIPATTAESLQQGYVAVAQQLDIPGYDADKADVPKLVQNYLSSDGAGQWLLVFDNADDIEMWTATSSAREKDARVTVPDSLHSSRRLIDCLPRNQRGCVVFTTRDRKAAVKLAQQNIVKVPEMSDETATQLLTKSLADVSLVDDSQDVSNLLVALTHLPLAITQAAAYINANAITLADYISLLEKKEEEAIEILSEDFEDEGRYQEVKNPIATTWLISFEQIRRSSPLAAEFLSFMACISPRDIPLSLLPPGPSRKKEMDAIGTLDAYSFINRRSASASLDLHRLVYLATRNWLRKEGLLKQQTETTVVQLEEVFPDDDESNRATWRLYLAHAQQALASDLVDECGEERLALMWRCGRCLQKDGRWNEAEVMLTEVLAIETKVLGVEALDTIVTTADLAFVYMEQGRWQEAEQLQVQVLEARKTKLGVDHPDTLTSINNLASTYYGQGRLHEAEQLQVQVLEAKRTKLGVDHPHTLTSMDNLAMTYWRQGRSQEAEQLGVQVLEARKTKLGVNHPNTLTSMSNLALTLNDLKRDVEAIQLMRDCVERRLRVLGSTHLDYIYSSETLNEWQAGHLEL